MTKHEDVANEVIEMTQYSLERKNVDWEKLNLTIQNASNLCESAAYLIESSREIFLCTIDLAKTITAMNYELQKHQASLTHSAQRAGEAAKVTREMIEKNNAKVEKILEKVMDIDVNQCSEREILNRGKLIDMAMAFNEQSYHLLMKFMSI